MFKKAFGIGIALCLALLCVQPVLAAEAEETTALNESVITVVNNITGVPDTIAVSSIVSGDIIKVYATSSSASPIAVSKSAGTSLTCYVDQLGKADGTVYLTVTSAGKAESNRTAKTYTAEGQSAAPSAESITVANNITGMLDTVALSGLANNDIVRIYATASATTPIAVDRASSEGSALVYIDQLSTGEGSVYVSVQGASGKIESARTAKSYGAEKGTTALTVEQITVTNNVAGTEDTVYVTGLKENDVVKVYGAATGGTLLGSATVTTPAEATPVTTATITIEQLGTAAGKVYVSVTNTGANESARTAASYTSETTTTLPAASVKVTNNYVGTDDTVEVSGLVEGDIISVYATSTSTPALGTATVAKGETSAVVSIDQLGSAAGKVYVTIKKENKAESARTTVAYIAEPTATALSADAISVTNNITRTPDTVIVTGLAAGDVVNVYATSSIKTALATATVGEGKTSVDITIEQIGVAAGKVYVTVKGAATLESARTAKSYDAEASTDALSVEQITVTNNVVGTDDTVYVTGLKEDDVVKVYSAATGGTLLGSATVTTPAEATPVTTATITIEQLGTAAGKVYVSVTNTGANESKRVAASYSSETTTTLPAASVKVTNNYVGTDDTVEVSGLVEGDVISVYATSTSTPALGTATVAKGETSAIISIDQLSSAAGRVYVTIKKENKAESARTSVSYIAEPTATALSADAISVTNNITGTPDTVSVTGLAAGDVVNVYATSSIKTALATATVGEGKTSVEISIEQIGVSAGKVYVTVKGAATLESPRAAKAFIAETGTDALSVEQITVTNNVVGVDDTVYVTGLNEGDVVKVYSASTAGTLLGSATVTTPAPEGEGEAIPVTTATITIEQLGTAAGRVYVSVANTGANESKRVAASYSSETSIAPSSAKISVKNNYTGTSDEVTVSGLLEGDLVKVYASTTATETLGTATVGSGENTATITVAQLGTAAGRVYVSVTSTNKAESSKTTVSYTAEPTTTAPAVSTITVTNKVVGSDDTVLVSGLAEGDVVNVYASTTAATALGTATVAEGETSVTVNIAQLGTGAGRVYVSVKKADMLESAKTGVSYTSEISTVPYATNILVMNNKAGTTDTVTVGGLKEGDVVKIYDAAKDGNVIGTGTVSSGKSGLVISIDQIGTSAGKIYVSVTSVDKAESRRTTKAYTAE